MNDIKYGNTEKKEDNVYKWDAHSNFPEQFVPTEHTPIGFVMHAYHLKARLAFRMK
jgi:hypothetical protein